MNAEEVFEKKTEASDAATRPNRDEAIRLIAYHLWLAEGQPEGRDQEHWLKAEAIWQERQAMAPASDAVVVKRKSATKRSPAPKKPAVRRARAKKEQSAGPPEQT
jgi:hypothetical protein